MSTIIRYRDSDKPVHTPIEDFVTLSNYHDSFYKMNKVSNLRMAIVPGTVKYFNKAFSSDALSGLSQGNTITEVGLIPLINSKKKFEDDCDYSSYPKLS